MAQRDLGLSVDTVFRRPNWWKGIDNSVDSGLLAGRRCCTAAAASSSRIVRVYRQHGGQVVYGPYTATTRDGLVRVEKAGKHIGTMKQSRWGLLACAYDSEGVCGALTTS